MPYKTTFWQQAGALIKRNFLLKRRVKRQIIMEVLFPFCFVVVLGLIRLRMRSTDEQPAIPSYPTYSITDPKFLRSVYNATIYVSPNTAAVESLMVQVVSLASRSRIALSYKTFPSASDAETAYRNNYVSNKFEPLGINFADGTLNNPSYTIRSSFLNSLNGAKFSVLQAGCRNLSLLMSPISCPANYYLVNGFAFLQRLLDTVIIQTETKKDYLQLNISTQILPKDVYSPPMAALQNIASLWFIFTYFPFVLFIIIILVGEKEKKIKEGMRMMGMKDGAYWFSWAVCYTVIILGVTILVTIVTAAMRILRNSNLGYFLLLNFEYGLTLITISFMLTPFFNKAQIAGGVASMATIVFGFLYLAISLTRYSLVPDGYLSTIPSWGQWLLALFSPVALALSIDQFFFLDLYRNGLNQSTIGVGQFSVRDGLIILAFDFVLYGLLGLYFDNVVPTEYGPRQSLCYCFMPSYWMGNEKKAAKVDLSSPNTHSDNIELMPADAKTKTAISISNLTKQFKVQGKTMTAVNGISLDIYEGQITALLGHNGAGKTTLISMLTGLTAPTSGTASVYDLDITNAIDMSEIRTIFGVCPQHDILFDLLSPYEHLYFFAALKGVPSHDIERVVTNKLADCDLSAQRDTPSEKLSGGQKRKLSVAIALIGDPKIVLLDEPTAGMDPVSRRHLWNLLKSSRADRVILLTTHFMDEADILADRKAIVSKGKLKCVGSSLFLKNRFGLGYHLGLEITENAVVNDITNAVRSQIPSALLARVHGREMTFTLPLSNVAQFSALFAMLEKQKSSGSSGIAGFGIAMTSLEEVFLQIGEEEVDEDDTAKANEVAIAIAENEPVLDGKEFSAEFDSIFRQERNENLLPTRFLTLMKIRLLLMLRSKKAVIVRLVLPLLLTLAGALVQKYVTVSANSVVPLASSMYPNMYTKVTGDTGTTSNPNFLYGNGSAAGGGVSTFENRLTSSGITLEPIPSNITTLLGRYPHYMGLDVFQMDVNTALPLSYSVLYNDSAYLSLPVVINTVSNAVLKMMSSSKVINATSLMWPSLSVNSIALGGALTTSLLMGLAIAIVPPFFAVAIVKDKEIKARSQLRIAGITDQLYWGTAFLVDFCQYFIVCLLLLVILVAVQGTESIGGAEAATYIIMFIIFVPDLLLFVYVLSFGFQTADNTQTVLTAVFVLGSFLPFLALSIVASSVSSSAGSMFHIILSFLDPPYGVMGLLYCMQNTSLTIKAAEGASAVVDIDDYMAWSSNIPLTYISGVVHLAIWFTLLILLELAKTNRGLIGYIRRSRKIESSSTDFQDIEDIDVKEERKKVEQWANNQQSSQVPVVCVRNLYKEFEKYSGGACGNCGGSAIKVAVAHNSFLVNVGEVFGLLGPNGAGKTTTMNMVIAEEAPTRGEVLLFGQDLQQNTNEALSALGYCPQHNPLWDELTLQEHLEIYAAIRGVTKTNIPIAINYFLKALKLGHHAKKFTNNLSGGTKRKLCYCISLLGGPRVVLLDEPSTGMDPKSKRFLWDTISATFRSDKRGAILTTHYMEEANALCSRIGIMINGRLECLGSAQHLKNKYGSGYTLEVKLAPSTLNTEQSNLDRLNAYLNGVIPGLVITEIFGDRITYAVPAANKTALSEVFQKLEQGKSVVGIEEYSFSQSTLEQVFLSFAKRQLSEEEVAAHNRLITSSSRNLGVDNSAAETDVV